MKQIEDQVKELKIAQENPGKEMFTFRQMIMTIFVCDWTPLPALHIYPPVVRCHVASTTGFILALTAVAQTACKRQRQRCFWLAIYF